MRFETDGDRVAVETDQQDRELVRALGDVATAGVDLAQTAGLIGAETGTCEDCGDEDVPLREMPVQDGEQVVAAALCGECQQERTDQAVGAGAPRKRGIDPNTLEPDDIDPADFPDEVASFNDAVEYLQRPEVDETAFLEGEDA